MEPVLEIVDLKTYFRMSRGVIKAVDGVSFSLSKGETVGIVGESGCGKSVLALSIMRLVPKPAGKIIEGNIIFNGKDILDLSETGMRRIREKKYR